MCNLLNNIYVEFVPYRVRPLLYLQFTLLYLQSIIKCFLLYSLGPG